LRFLKLFFSGCAVCNRRLPKTRIGCKVWRASAYVPVFQVNSTFHPLQVSVNLQLCNPVRDMPYFCIEFPRESA
jgi:hypothetical protein